MLIREGDRVGTIVNRHETFGPRPDVLVVRWMDTGKVGLLFALQ
jgi:hypothetical protein